MLFLQFLLGTRYWVIEKAGDVGRTVQCLTEVWGGLSSKSPYKETLQELRKCLGKHLYNLESGQNKVFSFYFVFFILLSFFE